MVSCRSCSFPVRRNAAVLGFLIAGLLVSCASSASITWELNACRRRPAFSSHLLSTIEIRAAWIAGYKLTFRYLPWVWMSESQRSKSIQYLNCAQSVVAEHLVIAIFLPAVDLDYSRVDYSPRSAWIGSTLAALCAGITAATSAANPRSIVAPANSNGFHGVTPKSWLAMRYSVPIAAGIPQVRNLLKHEPRVAECLPSKIFRASCHMPLSGMEEKQNTLTSDRVLALE